MTCHHVNTTCHRLFFSQVYLGSGHPVFSMPGSSVVFRVGGPQGFGCKTPSPFNRFPLSPQMGFPLARKKRHTEALVSYSMTLANQLDKHSPPQPYNKTHKAVKALFCVCLGTLRCFSCIKPKTHPDP